VIQKLYSQFCGFQGSIPALMQQVQAAAAIVKSDDGFGMRYPDGKFRC
jgi:hypothetical protein